ncbi:MAG: sigma 54-interacting transcriptional regulator [Planctomycetes bacterium]|nr:sigma 54-interacting transcriptional regulator [Planctomycetota bacterium]
MPRLIVLENAKERVLELNDGSIAIGRHPDSQIVLQNPRASRQHCRIEPTGGGYRVVDAGSQNGTYVNGRLVTSRELRDGDCIEAGGARIFLGRIPEDDPGTLADAPEASRTIRIDEPVPMPTREEFEELRRERSRLIRLQRINRAITSELDLKRLLDVIMDCAIELTNAERGFLLLKDGEALRFEVARNFTREEVANPEAAVSRSIAEKVIESGEPLLSVNALEDTRLESARSIEVLGLRSVLCVPLCVRERVIGAIYLDNRLHQSVFDPEDLRTLEGFRDQAAIAIENARLYRELKDQTERVEGLNQELTATVITQKGEIEETRSKLREKQHVLEQKYTYKNIIGSSRAMQTMFRLLDRVIDSDVPVLIQGESGTGKELVARAIHFNSVRREARFVSENCAALPETLLEAELFGYMRGAFTGATRDKKGLFELAHKGTLFLDEVGDMSHDMQKKLLRVLQEKEVRPVGGKDAILIDVRIVSASNKDLKELVARGLFREDLYFRLQVVTVDLPPLRDRAEDIPLLVHHFLRHYSTSLKRTMPKMHADVMARLVDYEWPGNVRELENEVLRMLTLGGDEITLDVLSPSVRERLLQRAIDVREGVRDLNLLVDKVEREEIERALRIAEGNKTKAAALLKISRFTLQRKLAKFGIVTEDE